MSSRKNSVKATRPSKVGRASTKTTQRNNSKAKSYSSAAVSRQAVMVMAKPSISSSGSSSDGSIRVRHRELIANVNSTSAAFNGVTYPINPGLALTFPWLSTISLNYESYLFRSLHFEYETSVSTAIAGSVMLAVDFDAADDPPSTKVQLMSYHNAVRSAVWQESCFTCDSKDLQKFGSKRYIRSGAVPASADVKTYDVGNLQLFSQGIVASGDCGEIYVVYDVDLQTPQLNRSALIDALSFKLESAVGAVIPAATPFGRAVLTGQLPLTFDPSTIVFKTNCQLIINVVTGGTGLLSAANFAGSTATVVLLPAVINGATATDMRYVLLITALANQFLACSLSGTATTITELTFRAAPYALG